MARHSIDEYDRIGELPEYLRESQHEPTGVCDGCGHRFLADDLTEMEDDERLCPDCRPAAEEPGTLGMIDACLAQILAHRKRGGRLPDVDRRVKARAGIASRLNYGERFNEYPDRIPHKRGKEISKEVQHG